jgi:hypothetical protein
MQTPARSLGIALAVLAISAAPSLASDGFADPVVSAGGVVAGEGYAYWLAEKNRAFFDSGGAPAACETIHTGLGTALFLDGGEADHPVTCTAAPGEGVYVDGVSNECSTFKGDHSGYGTSAADLMACAKAGYASGHLRGGATVDGAAVADYARLAAATPAITVRVPAHNHFGVKAGAGTSACYGEGLLLTNLAPGTHTIRIRSHVGSGGETTDYTLHVQ